jgi:starvation-inducible DNA-binding protein
MEIDIGIKEQDRARIAEGLSRLLADSYTLYLKTHYFHWNVTGPMFQTLHLMFETQYNELALAVDQVAERIRALGFTAPGTYSEFARLSSIKETVGVPKAQDMIRELVEGQEAVVRTARSFSRRLRRPPMRPAPTCSHSASSCTRRRPGCCAVCWSNKGRAAARVGSAVCGVTAVLSQETRK